MKEDSNKVFFFESLIVAFSFGVHFLKHRSTILWGYHHHPLATVW